MSPSDSKTVYDLYQGFDFIETGKDKEIPSFDQE